MHLRIGQAWYVGIGMAAILTTLIGLLVMAVHKVRMAAERTSDL